MSKLGDKLRSFYYYDPDELGEDAFKHLGDDEIEEVKALFLELIDECDPASEVRDSRTRYWGNVLRQKVKQL